MSPDPTMPGQAQGAPGHTPQRQAGPEAGAVAPPWSLRFGLLSDPGLLRERNEDACAVYAPWEGEVNTARGDALFLVADGMGGHEAGDRASRHVASELRQWFTAGPTPEPASEEAFAEALEAAVLRSHDSLLALAKKEHLARGAGSTLTALCLRGDQLHVAHVGDSRLYRVRDQALVQLTRDHAWVAEQLRAGAITPEEALHHPQRHMLTQCLGVGADVQVDLLRFDALPGDRYLLCSDGLHGPVGEGEILDLLLASDDAQETARALVARANAASGPDNITAVVLYLVPRHPARAALLDTDPGLPWAEGGLRTDAAVSLRSGLRTDPEASLPSGLGTDSAVNPEAGLGTDPEASLRSGLRTDPEASLPSGLGTDSAVSPEAGPRADSNANPHTGREAVREAGAGADREAGLEAVPLMAPPPRVETGSPALRGFLVGAGVVLLAVALVTSLGGERAARAGGPAEVPEERAFPADASEEGAEGDGEARSTPEKGAPPPPDDADAPAPSDPGEAAPPADGPDGPAQPEGGAAVPPIGEAGEAPPPGAEPGPPPAGPGGAPPEVGASGLAGPGPDPPRGDAGRRAFPHEIRGNEPPHRPGLLPVRIPNGGIRS